MGHRGLFLISKADKDAHCSVQVPLLGIDGSIGKINSNLNNDIHSKQVVGFEQISFFNFVPRQRLRRISQSPTTRITKVSKAIESKVVNSIAVSESTLNKRAKERLNV